jgi:HlyD family secretion protein
MKRAKLTLISLLIVVFGLPITAYLAVKKNQPSVIGQVESAEDESKSIFLAGTVQADDQVELRFQTSGYLAWVGVEKGDYVEKNQAIASLDKDELEKKLQKQVNSYLSERWDFEQVQDDYQQEKDLYLITDEIKRILEKAQFGLDNAVLDVEIRNMALKYSTLTTPIGGIVIDIDQPFPGVNITPANAKFIIADPESVYFRAEADEEEIVKIKPGMKGTILLDAYPDKEFESEVVSVDFAPLPGSRTTSYGIKMALPGNKDLRFRLEMGGEVEFFLQ